MGIPNEAGCCKKEAQVISALGDQENAVDKFVSLAEELRSRLDAVMTPPTPPGQVDESDVKGEPPFTSPLADKIHSINSRARYGQIVLQDILNRLEI